MTTKTTKKTAAAPKKAAASKRNERFVTKQQDDSLWYVWDKKNQTYSVNGYVDRSTALKLAKTFEDHATKLNS